MKKVAIVGNGNWGTCILKLVANNIQNYCVFDHEVLLWVYEEIYQNQKLSEYINAFKSNPIYLPGVKLPNNIKAVTELDEVEQCDIVIICLPHQFIKRTLSDLKMKKGAYAINLSKGMIIEDGKLYLPSEYISKVLKIDCCCLMGANIAKDVAKEEICDCTIGYANKAQYDELEMLFDNDYFRPKIIPYNKGMEICGGLKNIISIGFGIVEGIEYGSNTKAMVFRQGLIEMERFCSLIGAKFMVLESCCVGDLFTSCMSGRNVQCGILMSKDRCKYQDVERTMRGQKLQGPETSKVIHEWLVANNHDTSKFPVMEAIYRICHDGEDGFYLVSILKKCKS